MHVRLPEVTKKAEGHLQVVGRRTSKILPRIGAMNQLAEVGRVTPSTLRSSDGLVSALGISATEDGCAPFFV